jgi:hypothetical protein
MKSSEVLTLREAQNPITTVSTRYAMIEKSNNASVRLLKSKCIKQH